MRKRLFSFYKAIPKLFLIVLKTRKFSYLLKNSIKRNVLEEDPLDDPFH